MKNNCLLFLILGVIIVVLFFAFLGHDSTTKHPKDVHVFEKSGYAYTFTYPKDHYIDITSQGVSITSLAPEDVRRASSIGLANTITIATSTEDIDTQIQQLQSINCNTEVCDSRKTQEILITGIEAVYIEYIGAYAGETHATILFERENILYTLHFIKNSETETAAQQIISTFTFLD